MLQTISAINQEQTSTFRNIRLPKGEFKILYQRAGGEIEGLNEFYNSPNSEFHSLLRGLRLDPKNSLRAVVIADYLEDLGFPMRAHLIRIQADQNYNRIVKTEEEKALVFAFEGELCTLKNNPILSSINMRRRLGRYLEPPEIKYPELKVRFGNGFPNIFAGGELLGVCLLRNYKESCHADAEMIELVSLVDHRFINRLLSN